MPPPAPTRLDTSLVAPRSYMVERHDGGGHAVIRLLQEHTDPCVTGLPLVPFSSSNAAKLSVSRDKPSDTMARERTTRAIHALTTPRVDAAATAHILLIQRRDGRTFVQLDALQRALQRASMSKQEKSEHLCYVLGIFIFCNKYQNIPFLP